ncbi:MAG: SURF1 family protein [Candidatus Nanopelagicaceae bacterium]|nr:SURF1 family protein [Candidatus Nanopelagicaceae bacterium]
MKRIVGASLLAVILVALCIQGARWQFDRHEVRHAKNELIRANIAKAPIMESDLTILSLNEVAWRSIKLTGRFNPESEILVRNRYHEGKYGFGVVTLFQSSAGKSYWVDRGWVVAGKDALTPPETKPVSSELISIEGRVRVENIEAQISGTVFAVPGNDGGSQLARWNNEKAISTEPFYFDLVSSDNSTFTPDVPATLPELSDGPHLAYTVQWVLFAGLVLFGLYLVIREERKVQAEKL